jgi:hypothetical protein
MRTLVALSQFTEHVIINGLLSIYEASQIVGITHAHLGASAMFKERFAISTCPSAAIPE